MADLDSKRSDLSSHLEFARRLARTLIPDAARRGDAVQDACVAALENPPTREGAERAHLSSILRRVAGRSVRSDRRRRRREQAVPGRESTLATDELVAAMEVHRIVVDELLGLPGPTREVLLLRFFEDLSAREVADRLGEPVETVRTRIKRGIARLRQRMDVRDVSWSASLFALLGDAVDAQQPRGRWPVWLRLPIAATALVATLMVASFGWNAVQGGYGTYTADYPQEVPGGGALGMALAMSLPVVSDPPPFATALKIAKELRDYVELELPELSDRKRIADACGVPTRRLPIVKLFRAKRGEESVFLAHVAIGDEAERGFAVLVLDADRKFLDGVVVDTKGKGIAEWTHLLKVLRWSDVPRITTARPWSELERVREKAGKTKDVESRLPVTMLEVLGHMHELASVFNLPPAKTRDPVAECGMMARQFRFVAGLADALKPVLGDKTADFRRHAMDSAGAAEAVGAALEKEDGVAARAARKRLFGSCRACHNLKSSAFEGRLKFALVDRRRKLGIGDGFYRLGHDLRIGHADRKRAQVTANAFRVAALMIDAVGR